MNAFNQWNLRLLREYFSPSQSGSEVFLDATAAKLDELGPDLGGAGGLLQAVRSGPCWPCGNGLTERVLDLVRQRRQQQVRPRGYLGPAALDATYIANDAAGSAPTYLPYLAAFVQCWAASQEGDAEGGFYARLRADLALPQDWGPREMALVVGAWEDLQAWSRATNGRFGRFVARQLGAHPYVGYLRAQSVLSGQDVSTLQQAFADCGLEGGAAMTPELYNTVVNAIPHHGISVGLRTALAEMAFRPLLMERIASLLTEWDGTQSETAAGAVLRPGLALVLGHGNQLPWGVRLVFPSIDVDGEDGRIQINGLGLPLERGDAGGAVCELTPEAVAMLAGNPWNANIGAKQVGSPLKQLWILQGKTTADGRWELVESSLPASGNVYLLASSDGAAGLESYLGRTNPAYQPVQSDGLPEGWKLVFLPEQTLAGDKRLLPDGAAGPHAVPRPIRFEGGVSTIRNGRRVYLAYDPPMVVFDAPSGAVLYCSEQELHPLEPEVAHAIEGEVVPLRSAVRRYQLPDCIEKGGVFTLVAKRDGHQFASQVIRIAADSSPRPAGGGVSLDPLGRIQANGRGLWGGLSADVWDPDHDGLQVPRRIVESAELGLLCEPEALLSSVGGKFLDALGGAGSMAYGRARDLAHRLLRRGGLRASPHRLIDQLWSRGHLEVERNARGHWVRVHAVPPAIYGLPASTGAQCLYGVLGTLQFGHWRALASRGRDGVDWHAHVDGSVDFLPAVRIASACSSQGLEGVLEGIGVKVLPCQALALAEWSADSDRLLQDLVARRYERIGHQPKELKVFNPQTGRFGDVPDMMRPAAAGGAPRLRLYQMVDAYTERHRLHVVATPEGFSFAFDPRWAIWLALESMCEFLARAYPTVFGDLERWPLVLSEDGDLWLPEGLRLPTVLERAAVLCHGAPPDRFEMEGGLQDRKCILRNPATQIEVLEVDPVYEGMANGRWLRYRWVPREVANAIQGQPSP